MRGLLTALEEERALLHVERELLQPKPAIQGGLQPGIQANRIRNRYGCMTAPRDSR